MNTASQSISFSRVNAKSIVVGGLCVLLIVALFFIPEIVSLQQSFSGDDAPATQELSKMEAPPVEQPLKVGAQEDALSEINRLFEGDYIETLKAKRVARSALGSVGLKDGQGQVEQESAELKLTWDNILSGPSESALKSAQKEALALANSLPQEKFSSKYALYTFASGVRMILESGERTMTALEAQRYADYLRSSVSGALAREGAERNYINTWSEISLGPVLEGLGAGDGKPGLIPFDPKLTLTWVKVLKPGARHHRYIESGPSYLRLRGYVMGKDVKNVDVFLNEIKIASIVPGRVDQVGRRFFNAGQWNAKGSYTFKVYDKFGQVYRKVYNFYPKVRKFPWTRGLFEVPFFGDRDKRLDRYFSTSAGRLLGTQQTNTRFADGSQIARF